MEFKVSFHATKPDVLLKIQKYNVDYIQVFLTNPRTISKPEFYNNTGIELIVHGPYPVNLTQTLTDKITKATLDHYVGLSHLMNGDSKRIVTHIGSRKGLDVTSAIRNIYTFCNWWLYYTSDDDTILCLENDSGSKSKSKMGSIKVLERVIREINDPRIRLAFDVEHAYANGFDISDMNRLESLLDIIEVIHFNTIPEFVVKGSHLDRHTSTTFDESKEQESLKSILTLTKGIRKIMEIDNSLLSNQYSWLNKLEV